MSAYISAIFEKTQIVTPSVTKVRLIMRNRDDGVVPPTPGPTYFPTQPNTLAYCIIGSASGAVESYVGIADMAEMTSVTARALDWMDDTTVNFSTAGVLVNDVIQVNITDPQYWTSAEYPGTNPFQFIVKTVAPGANVNRLELYTSFPAFYNGFNWTIPRLGLSGYAGRTLRNTTPGGTFQFRDYRFNQVFTTVVDLETAVTAMKADMLSLTNAVTGSELVNETVTVSSSL